MLFNYLKIAVRLVTRNKLVSIINIFGFALALSGSLLIVIFIHDELSYDRYHEHADRIYRVTRNYISPEGGEIMHLGHLAPPFAPLLKSNFPAIVETARNYGPFSTSVKLEESESYYEIENGYFAEPSVFKIFSIEILSGETREPLNRPLTMMISDKLAQAYFGHTDVVGKEIQLFDTLIEITGTYKSFPNQSHWHPEVLVSFNTLNDKELFDGEEWQNAWENNSFLTYILVNDEFDPKRTQQLFPSFIDRHMPSGGDSRKESSSTNLFLQPLTSIHLHSQLDSEAETNGKISHVYAMESIGLFLIFIACFNFINLSTARATQRGKEVGLRKVSGALRNQLIFQYLSESTLLTLLAMIVAVAMASAFLPWLNDFTGKTLNFHDYLNFNTLVILSGFVIAIGVMAGLYPALVISRFKPAQILKGQTGSMRDGSGVRKGLVVMQFSISIVMIIVTLITFQQLEFLNNKELGYSKDQILTFAYTDEARDHYEVFYNALKQHPAIVNVTRSNRIPTARLLETNDTSTEEGDKSGNKTRTNMKNVSVDQNFFGTYHIPFVSGTNFSKEVKNEDAFEDNVANGFILNESACKLLGWNSDQAIGKALINGETKGTVQGVVKDFHFESLHEPIAPIVFMTYANFRRVSVLVSASQMEEGIDHLENVWKRVISQKPLKYGFLSDRYNRLYENEASQRELLVIFSILAIFIASLGLFGLATFNTIQRSKEVSIRKVLGASVQSILQLLSKEIVILIVIANAVAWPIAWYFMNEWLGGFAYHIEMNLLTYAGAGLLTLLVSMLTISMQTLKVALTNPATMLRNE
jgi:putative ABC transport system permease protein